MHWDGSFRVQGSDHSGKPGPPSARYIKANTPSRPFMSELNRLKIKGKVCKIILWLALCTMDSSVTEASHKATCTALAMVRFWCYLSFLLLGYGWHFIKDWLGGYFSSFWRQSSLSLVLSSLWFADLHPALVCMSVAPSIKFLHQLWSRDLSPSTQSLRRLNFFMRFWLRAFHRLGCLLKVQIWEPYLQTLWLSMFV